MPPALLPDPGPDDSSDAHDDQSPEQGLYITLPAEQLTLAGFNQGGATDTMVPGALLATVVDTVAGPDGSGLTSCSDDQLLGIISAARRLESRIAWTVMAAIREFARRAGTGVEGEFAADELASELHMSQQGAAGQMEFATEIVRRLPKTFAALGAGLIHPIHLRIIEEETRYLTDADAAKADADLAGAAPGKTFGELRYAARKLVLNLDPDIARKRKEAARREAHVRRFQEESGNAGMVARELPSDEVLASWQHVEQRALDLRAAGLPGTLQELRVRAYLDLLQERDSRAAPKDPQSATRPAAAPTAPTAPTAPGRRRSPPPPHPLVRHRAEPRRHRRRPRLPPRPPPPARHRTPGYQTTRHRTPGRRPTGYQAPGHQATEHRATGNPQHPADPHHPRSLRPRPRPRRLPPQPRPPAPDPRPQRHLHRARLQPPRRQLRPGPHHRLGQGRPHLRMQPRPSVPASSPVQTGRRLAARAIRSRRPKLAHPLRPHLYHHPDRVPHLAAASLGAGRGGSA